MRKIREMRWDTMISEIFCEKQDKNFDAMMLLKETPN